MLDLSDDAKRLELTRHWILPIVHERLDIEAQRRTDTRDILFI